MRKESCIRRTFQLILSVETKLSESMKAHLLNRFLNRMTEGEQPFKRTRIKQNRENKLISSQCPLHPVVLVRILSERRTYLDEKRKGTFRELQLIL